MGFSTGFTDAWENWNIRAVILFSLTLQAFLVFVAPRRKFTGAVQGFIWPCYLLASSAANYSIGQISTLRKIQNAAPTIWMKLQEVAAFDGHLVAFWAPFVLLHFGGPDTITAFALEDNALWARYLFKMLSRVISVIYVLFKLLPGSTVLIPTVLVLLAGIIKYFERIWALYNSSLGKFRDSMLEETDPGPDYAKLMEEYASKIDSNLPTSIIYVSETDKEFKSSIVPEREGHRLDESEVVQYAFYFFNIFKGLLVDRAISYRDCNESKTFFIGGEQRDGLEAEDALRVIEVELNFIYEVFYTKLRAIRSAAGYVLRFIAFGSIVGALIHFHFIVKKEKFYHLDKIVCYGLLLGAVALEAVALCMLLFSDWTFAQLKKLGSDYGHQKCSKVQLKLLLAAIIIWFLSFKKSRWRPIRERVSMNNTEHEVDWTKMVMPFLFGRWSGSVPTFNLIRYCLTRNPENRYRSMNQYPFFNEAFTKELWEFIFKALKEKSQGAADLEAAKRIYSARGNWVLTSTKFRADYSHLMHYVIDVPYDESVLLWHIATEICYNTNTHNVTPENYRYYKFSKILSDYMLLLLLTQESKVISDISGIGRRRFRDTCAEARMFFRRRLGPKGTQRSYWRVKQNQIKEACEEIISVNTDIEPSAVKGDESKSVLFEASRLAKALKEGREDVWEMVSNIWVELLAYAATHCGPTTHARQVSRGGGLFTFVWLLMAHFGIGEQFHFNVERKRAKFIVHK